MAYEHKVTQRYAVQEWKNPFEEQRCANNGWKRLNAAHGTRQEQAAKRIKLQFADRPADPVSSSSASRSDATAGGDAQDAGNAVAGGAAPDAAQDTTMSGGADGRRSIPRETEDDEERAKRQRTEKKTELEMEVSNVAKINDRRRILDLRRDGCELENIRHRDAAMFCACELRPRVIRTRCTKRNQLESTWDLCRAQRTQGLGYVCEFVGSIADDPMTKNIQNSTGCNATIIRESVTGQSISVISNVDNIRRRLQRAMQEIGLLNSQDIDRVVEDSLDEEGEEMVADDVKKGIIPIRLVNQAKTKEQKYIEKMKVLDVVDRKKASGSKVIRTKWVVTNKGTPEKPNVWARWVAQEYK